MNLTQIKKKVDVIGFIEIVKKYKENQIECTQHTFFRLSESQRKIYRCGKLSKILLEDKPFLVGIQLNGNHAVFYRYGGKILKMIISIETRKINIVTFYFIREEQVPKV